MNIEYAISELSQDLLIRGENHAKKSSQRIYNTIFEEYKEERRIIDCIIIPWARANGVTSKDEIEGAFEEAEDIINRLNEFNEDWLRQYSEHCLN